MDWSLISLVAFFALLAGHLLFDLRSLVRNLRERNHSSILSECEHCHAHVRGGRELRHETIWAVAAIVVLGGHIITDFMRW